MAQRSRPTVIFVHEDPGTLGELAEAVRGDNRLAWAGGYTTLDAKFTQCRRQPADVVIIDAGHGGRPRDAISAVPELGRLWPRMGVLVLAEEADLPSFFEAVNGGAVGYLPRTSAVPTLLDAAYLAHRGCAVFSHATLKILSDRARSGRAADPGWPDLRRAEMQILAHLSTGASQKETAESLGLAYQTVRNVCQRIYRQLGVNSRRAAVTKYLAGIRTLN